MISIGTRVALVLGPSAAGKSRLLAGVKALSDRAAVLPGLRFAQRYTTRAQRERETFDGENLFVADEEFTAKVNSRELDVYWGRVISDRMTIRYGFSLGAYLAEPGLVVLSGNNYLDWRRCDLLRLLRQHERLLVLRVFADDETRMSRLLARRPPLGSDELESRMRDRDPRDLAPADGVIVNNSYSQTAAEGDVVSQLCSFVFMHARDGNAGVLA